MVLGEGLPGRKVGSLRESRHCESVSSECQVLSLEVRGGIRVCEGAESEWSCAPNESKAELRGDVAKLQDGWMHVTHTSWK